MPSKVLNDMGVEFPLVAFSHCRDVVVEVSKAGGLGVFGAAGTTPEELQVELAWIRERVAGKPFGLDLIIPSRHEAVAREKSQGSSSKPGISEHSRFIRDLLQAHDIDASDLSDERLGRNTTLADNVLDDAANRLLDVAFANGVGLIANALGVPPGFMRDRAKSAGVRIAALVGTPEQAAKQAEAGVDIIVAAGTEAGGHCGEISTMVLVPQVCRALRGFADVAVLGAGGIVTGRQMAACMAMGAQGVWTGSVWLTTVESEISKVIRDKLIAAGARDTVRTRARSGKPCRVLKSAWTDAWEAPGAPKPLPMPVQFNITERPMKRILKLADSGHPGAIELATYFVGQGVGMMDRSTSCRDVVYEFMEDFLAAKEALSHALENE